MKGLPILVLLSSAMQLCSAVPVLEPVTCGNDNGTAAARLAMHHIDEHHHHGYKFRLTEIHGNEVEKVDGGCNIELQLDLAETECHTVNPKYFEDCETRAETDSAVKANCTVNVTVRNGEAKVTNYQCDTHQALSGSEMVRMCPDCPRLVSLSNAEGNQGVKEAITKFNQNTTNQNYYVLQEVGRIKSGYMMMAGMMYYPEFALVETHCPMGTRIAIEACQPLCPDRAHHAVCRSSYSPSKGLGPLQCDFYPPSNTTARGPGEQEPVCRPPGPKGPPGGPRPPPQAHGDGLGPPPHAHGQGPPPHAHGPPPHAGRPFHHCHGSDPALHPICPWPGFELRPSPRGQA